MPKDLMDKTREAAFQLADDEYPKYHDSDTVVFRDGFYKGFEAGAASVDRVEKKCGNCGFEPYDPEIFDECGGVRLDLIKPPPAEPKCSCVGTIDPNCPRGHGHRPPTTEPASECTCDENGHCNSCLGYDPTAPPAIEDRAKALLDDVRDFLHELRVDDCGYAELIARYATLHAQAEIDRQRPEIERAAVENFMAEVWFVERMQAVKTRGEQG